LPIILPGALLLVGFAAFGRWRETRATDGRAARWLHGIRVTAGVLLVSMLAVTFWQQSRPIFGYVEYAGLIPRLEALSSKFADNDLIVVESRDASDVHVLALPL